jgi:DNA integrity scanning protein DisA with diadenylate cyclase activity
VGLAGHNALRRYPAKMFYRFTDDARARLIEIRDRTATPSEFQQTLMRAFEIARAQQMDRRHGTITKENLDQARLTMR